MAGTPIKRAKREAAKAEELRQARAGVSPSNLIAKTLSDRAETLQQYEFADVLKAIQWRAIQELLAKPDADMVRALKVIGEIIDDARRAGPEAVVTSEAAECIRVEIGALVAQFARAGDQDCPTGVVPS